MNIPAGWTYTRCDRYTKDEFRARHRQHLRVDIIEKYIEDNPKEYYDTDDEIAIHYILQERTVPGLLHGQNRKTTKRTWYTD